MIFCKSVQFLLHCKDLTVNVPYHQSCYDSSGHLLLLHFEALDQILFCYINYAKPKLNFALVSIDSLNCLQVMIFGYMCWHPSFTSNYSVKAPIQHSQYCLIMQCLKYESTARCFQPGEGPSKARDFKILLKVRFKLFELDKPNCTQDYGHGLALAAQCTASKQTFLLADERNFIDIVVT